jgi:hypothetical protein
VPSSCHDGPFSVAKMVNGMYCSSLLDKDKPSARDSARQLLWSVEIARVNPWLERWRDVVVMHDTQAKKARLDPMDT